MSVDLLLNKGKEVLRHLSKAMQHGIHWLHWWAAGPLRALTVQGAVVIVDGLHVTLLWLLWEEGGGRALLLVVWRLLLGSRLLLLVPHRHAAFRTSMIVNWLAVGGKDSLRGSGSSPLVASSLWRLLLMLSLVIVGGRLVGAVVAPAVSSVLVSEFPLILVPPFPVSLSFPFSIFPRLVVGF